MISKKILIILFLITIMTIISLFLTYYHKFYKFRRSIYYKDTYVNYNKSKYIKNIHYNDNGKLLFQTYYDKSKIPQEVYENIKKYASEYEHIVLDDNDIISFLNIHYNDNVIKTFKSLKMGAHKADLARYCLLYIYGGIYMDIKVELIKPLSEIFNKGNIFYSIESNYGDHIHQAVIKTPQHNPLFLSLIDYIVTNQNPSLYIDFCRDLYIQIKNDVPNLKLKLNTGISGNKYYLFKEKCSSYDSSMCYDGFDRYKLCCFIWDGDKPVIKSRRASFPWK
jgi:mannosyltransferase OCH1-like enzyme